MVCNSNITVLTGYPPDEHFDDAEEEVEHTESYNKPESLRSNSK